MSKNEVIFELVRQLTERAMITDTVRECFVPGGKCVRRRVALCVYMKIYHLVYSVCLEWVGGGEFWGLCSLVYSNEVSWFRVDLKEG